jgi:hypothetical protein
VVALAIVRQLDATCASTPASSSPRSPSSPWWPAVAELDVEGELDGIAVEAVASSRPVTPASSSPVTSTCSAELDVEAVAPWPAMASRRWPAGSPSCSRPSRLTSSSPIAVEAVAVGLDVVGSPIAVEVELAELAGLDVVGSTR